MTATSVAYTTLLRERIDVSVTALGGFSAAISFPAYYASMIRVSIWIYILAFLPTLSEEIGFMAIPVSAVLVLFFYLIFSIGRVMLDPFEGKPHDTPMSSIVRTIEINLLEQIGDDNIPAPLEPIKGRYLM